MRVDSKENMARRDSRNLSILLAIVLLMGGTTTNAVRAESPLISYMFPAGGQRGTQVEVRVGGCNLYETPRFFLPGKGIQSPQVLQPTTTVWFEGPMIPQPPSQQREDYPRDYLATLQIAADAPVGQSNWRAATGQGVTASLGFIVGDFPEIVEQEQEGRTPPQPVTLPVTINGRTFPREDVDTYRFTATSGQVITCHAATSAFGSPLKACVAILDSGGKVLAEAVPAGSATPMLNFAVPIAGDYIVRIHDVGYQGLQNHVYRLTLTAGPVIDTVYPLGGRCGQTAHFEVDGVNLPERDVALTLPTTGTDCLYPSTRGEFSQARLELDELDEFLEQPAKIATFQTFTIPGVLNGRVQQPGEEDAWQFTATKGLEYEFDVHAARCGSYLDPVIWICDKSGKSLKEADDVAGLQTDARLKWTSPDDGEYQFRIRDRLASRGDRRYTYRVRVTTAVTPNFSVRLASDAVSLEPGQSAKVKVLIDRGLGFNVPIDILWDQLPPGLTVESPCTVAANQKEGQVTLKADKDARPTTAPIRLTGVAKAGDVEIRRAAVTIATSTGPDAEAVADPDSALWTSITIPTPFKFLGIFESKYVPRGAVYIRKYRIERNGFTGPLQVQLADRQGRHLQGVTAKTVQIAADQDEFEFAVVLPPWMEVGRTCRSTLSMTGETTGPDGISQTICYSSNDQHNQMIALVATGRLSLQTRQTSLQATPNSQREILLQIQRGPGITGPVTLDLAPSKSNSGVTMNRVVVDANQTDSRVTLQFGSDIQGVGLNPLIIRAVSLDERGLPVTAELKLNLIE